MENTHKYTAHTTQEENPDFAHGNSGEHRVLNYTQIKEKDAVLKMIPDAFRTLEGFTLCLVW